VAGRSRTSPARGFRPCTSDEEGAYVDLDRYAYRLENGEASIGGDDDLGRG
jgi:hypothetical protein